MEILHVVFWDGWGPIFGNLRNFPRLIFWARVRIFDFVSRLFGSFDLVVRCVLASGVGCWVVGCQFGVWCWFSVVSISRFAPLCVAC